MGSAALGDFAFKQSFADGSSLDLPLNQLNSEGTSPTQFSIGGDPQHAIQGNDLGLNTNDANTYLLGLIQAALARTRSLT